MSIRALYGSESQAMSAQYRSIFLESDWAHTKYFGWSVVHDKPGLRVLKKRQAVFDRYLSLVTSSGHQSLNDVVAPLISPTFLGEFIVHDFDMIEPKPTVIAGRTFAPLTQHQRMLNINTIVVDLTQSEEALQKQMSEYYPRDIRRAQRKGAVVEAHVSPSEQLQAAFVSAYAEFAASRSLRSLDGRILSEMYRQRNAVLFTARNGSIITNYLHVYRAGPSACLMWGVNQTKDAGAGTLLHWEAMRYFKREGLSWFDLGGVATFDPSDGVYSFKRRLGGREMRLGTELGYATYAFSSARRLASILDRRAI